MPAEPGAFLSTALHAFHIPADPDHLCPISDALLDEFQPSLNAAAPTMLPSYIFRLPNGQESGTALAVDLGGSTLRVAVIELRAHSPRGGDNAELQPAITKTLQRQSWSVDESVKRLKSVEFFDWIAMRIEEVIRLAGEAERVLKMGVTWSFPTQQTSLSSGNILMMGKGFAISDEIAGTDLRQHFEAAFARRRLKVRMTALMNDTEATLLSHAYANPSTRMSLICGTGFNAAIQLPISALAPEKFGTRPRQWLNTAKAVLINTESSMFGGKGILPFTKWDRQLDRDSPRPGFQPIEQMISGRYLGEITRYVLVDAVHSGALFEGKMPEGMEKGYSLDTRVTAAFEGDGPLDEAARLLTSTFCFASPPTPSDLSMVRAIALAVSERAALYLGVAVYSLWRLQRNAFAAAEPSTAAVFDAGTGPINVAFCGSVLEKHPSVRRRCQEVLDMLVEAEEKDGLDAGTEKGVHRRLLLAQADDSGLLGAAVGCVVNELAEKEVNKTKARL